VRLGSQFLSIAFATHPPPLDRSQPRRLIPPHIDTHGIVRLIRGGSMRVHPVAVLAIGIGLVVLPRQSFAQG
jgi:hypothetical protein